MCPLIFSDQLDTSKTRLSKHIAFYRALEAQNKAPFNFINSHKCATLQQVSDGG